MSNETLLIRPRIAYLTPIGLGDLPEHGSDLSLEEYSEGMATLICSSSIPFNHSLNKSGIQSIIKTAFYTSLVQEEGHFCCFSLFLVVEGFYIDTILEFAEPMELSVAELSKISPACQNANMAFIIKIDSHDKPKILGIANLIGSRHYSSNGQVNASPSCPQTPLWVEVVGPGRIRVHNFVQPTQYILGHFEVISKIPEALFQELSCLIANKQSIPQPQTLDLKQLNWYYWYKFQLRTIVIRVLRQTAKLGRGGAFIFTRRPDHQDYSKSVRLKYQTNDDIGLGNILEEMIDDFSNHHQDGFYSEKAVQREFMRLRAFDIGRAIAEMSTVDGCVLIGPKINGMNPGASPG